MWKAIRNVASAVADLSVIAGKEIQHQVNKASDVTASVTEKISNRAAEIRTNYESDLEDRKSGIKKPVVVTEAEIPANITKVN